MIVIVKFVKIHMYLKMDNVNQNVQMDYIKIAKNLVKNVILIV